MRRTAALIVGGGPAGAAAAIGLARGGGAPLLIERDRETRDPLCGGFLSWSTIARLAALGVDPHALGAHRVDRLSLFAGGRRAGARLPRPAAALSRRALDTAMLAQAERAGAGIERGVAVRGLGAESVRLDDGGTIAASCIVLATGKHELRGNARPQPDGDPAMGLRWRLGHSPALARMIGHAIELHLFRGGYAGLVMQEDGANLCLAIRHSRFVEAGQRPEHVLAMLASDNPAIADRLAAAGSIGPAQAIANVPYGWRATTTEPGLYRVGDQAGVIPSLAGEGIAIALASGSAAAHAILHAHPAARFQSDFAHQLARPIPLGSLLWRVAERPLGAHALIAATRIAPALAGLAARLTRVG
jgi:flavin-dependent dehydrogenase